MTKEELQIKLGQLEAEKESLKKSDLEVRTELGKLIGTKYKPKDNWSRDNEMIIYSWMEIAFEIGKLKEVKRNTDLENGFKQFVDTVENRFTDIYENRFTDIYNKINHEDKE